MNETMPQPEPSIAAIGKAIRFGFASIVLGLSYFNIRLALSLHAFGAIYADMLGGKELPAATRLVLSAQPLLVALSLAFPLTAIVMIFAGRVTRSIYVSGCLILAVFVQLVVTSQAVSAPLFQIIRGMQEPGLGG